MIAVLLAASIVAGMTYLSVPNFAPQSVRVMDVRSEARPFANGLSSLLGRLCVIVVFGVLGRTVLKLHP